METIHISYLFMLFLAYSFIGWLWETSYCSIRHGRFINRGFLHGPLCPVYGVGGMLIMYLLQPWAATWIPLFFASMVIVSVVEYFTSWLLEVLFHTRWWDYSKERFNLHGRIFLGGAVCFGVMGTLCAHFVHPWLEKEILSIPLSTARTVAWILLAILLVDFFATIHGLVHFTIYQVKLKEFEEAVKHRFEDEWIATKKKSLEEHGRKFLRFVRNYPALTSREFHRGLEELRNRAN